jgi:hypothetical protein
LDLAGTINELFIASVIEGNFTTILHKKSVNANVSLLYNVSSMSVTIVDFDHKYNSHMPTIGPSLSSEQDKFYETPWFALLVAVLVLSVIAGLLFCLGFHWRTGVKHTKVQLRKIYVQPRLEAEEKEAESSSDSESDTEEVSVVCLGLHCTLRAGQGLLFNAMYFVCILKFEGAVIHVR